MTNIFNSLLKWIYAGLRAIARRLRFLFDFLWGLFSQWVTWMIGTTVAIWSWIWEKISDAISDGVGALTNQLDSYLSFGDGTFTSFSGLGAAVLNLTNFPLAVSTLVSLFTFWVLARSCRLFMIPIRAILEVI